MKLKLYYTGSTNHFHKYESEQEETFKSKDGIVAKVWIAKKQMVTRDEQGNVHAGGYPAEIEIVVGPENAAGEEGVAGVPVDNGGRPHDVSGAAAAIGE